ncbi:MAG: pirin family protein [Candidatus Moranbacteria bacterium]|nr:pirin family protein [Candidatus Moranbacteria bacterium]
MKSIFYGADTRGYAKHGWLTTRHSFSFASYYDSTRMGFGVLRVLNDDIIAPGAGFGQHPHDNMEIITIPLSGTLLHEDSLGNTATIETGEVQVMSAGTGVFHSEYNASKTESLSLLQIWIETAARDVMPRYDQKRFFPERAVGKWIPIVGPEGSAELSIYQNAVLSLGRFVSRKEIEYRVSNARHGIYLFVIEGVVTVDGQRLEARDALEVTESSQCDIYIDESAYLLVMDVPMSNEEHGILEA